MIFGYYCNLNYKDEDLFSFELIIHVSTVAKGPEIALAWERVDWVRRQALFVFLIYELPWIFDYP
jgi:hypothetical protein